MVEKQVDCLALFEPIQAQMAEARARNNILVFDYNDPVGEKNARSHIQSLRHVKTEIANVHKAAKAEALDIGRKIDGFKKKLTGEVDEMIAVHKEPIDRIQQAREEAEAKELRGIQEAATKKEADRLADLERREAVVREAEEKAVAEKQKEYDRVAEAERIAEQEKRDKRIAAEAITNAEIERGAERDRKECEARRDREYQAQKEQKRIANKKHRAKIEEAIYTRLAELEDVDKVFDALIAGSIPHVTIQY